MKILRHLSPILCLLVVCAAPLRAENVLRQVRSTFEESPTNATNVFRQVAPVLRLHEDQIPRYLNSLWQTVHKQIYKRRQVSLKDFPEEKAAMFETLKLLHQADPATGAIRIVALYPAAQHTDLPALIFRPDFETTALILEKELAGSPSEDFLEGICDLLQDFDDTDPNYSRALSWVVTALSKTGDLGVVHNLCLLIRDYVDTPQMEPLKPHFTDYFYGLNRDDLRDFNESSTVDLSHLDESVEILTPMFEDDAEFARILRRLRSLRDVYGLSTVEEQIWIQALNAAEGRDWNEIDSQLRARESLANIQTELKVLTEAKLKYVRNRLGREIYGSQLPKEAAQSLVDLNDADEAQLGLRRLMNRRVWSGFRRALLTELAADPKGYALAQKNRRCAHLIAKLGLASTEEPATEAP